MASKDLTEISEAISEFLPCIAALAFASTVILVSSSFSAKNAVKFQSAALVASGGVAFAFLLKNRGQVDNLWVVFKSVNDEIKFALAIVIVSATYFGASMFSLTRSASSASKIDLSTPASCDSDCHFVVPSSLPEKDQTLFEEIFDKIRVEIVNDLPTIYEMPKEAVSWVDRMIQYTVAGGKMNRGLALMAVQQTLATSRGKTLSDKERVQSAALGWCVEFLQAFFLVADDVMDDSVTRRGQPCWFRLSEVKLIAINDSFILESCVYKILKRYFGTESYYPQLVDLFIEVTRQTELGQLLDLTSQPLAGPSGAIVDLNRFTSERYTSIVKYKTAFYSFYLPVALGMIISGVKNPSQYQKAREILLIMGEYFQVQDDYLDCYGTPEVIGKIGTDIQDNKCSWLVVQALATATPAQRAVLEKNYGRHGSENVEAVKRLYREMGLEDKFKKYEEESYASIRSLMSEVHDIPSEVFEFLLRKIYKRSK